MRRAEILHTSHVMTSIKPILLYTKNKLDRDSEEFISIYSELAIKTWRVQKRMSVFSINLIAISGLGFCET